MSEFKKCNGCEAKNRPHMLPLSAFSKKGKRKQSKCKQCKNEYNRKHYQNNTIYYATKARKRDIELKEWWQSIKLGYECSECGENHHACLCFHHLDHEKKDIELANAIRNSWPKRRILEELKKCICLCMNCHTKLHWETYHPGGPAR